MTRGCGRRDPAALTAVGVFALFAAPSLLSGQGSLTGWTQLDDNATWFALTEHVLEHGRAIGAGDSSHAATLAGWLPSGYPVGALLPFGVAAKLSGQDLANALAPVVCAYAAILALGLRTIARCAGVGRWAAALVAVAATLASLFYGYAQLGGIKELATAALLPPAVWCALRAGRVRVAALAIVVAAALLGVLGAVGMLEHQLPLLQGAGLWHDADFRAATQVPLVAHLLALGALLAAVAAVAWLVRRGAADLPALVVVTVLGVAAAVVAGSPWIDVKALAIGSAFVLFAAAAAAALAVAAGSKVVRVAGGALATVLAVALGWSTLATARYVRLVARSRWEAWTRVPGARTPLARLPLGTPVNPVAPVACAALSALV